MAYKDLATGKNPPFEVNMLVEIPLGTSVKYEFDKASGYLTVDRLPPSAPIMPYPGNYGFIPHTLSDDGDPLDILTWGTEALAAGSVIAVRPIGVLIMQDEKGTDEKVICVPADSVSQAFSHIRDLKDLPPPELKKLEYFFTHYKDLDGQGRWSKTAGWGDAAKARSIIVESIDRENGRLPPKPGTGPAPAP